MFKTKRVLAQLNRATLKIITDPKGVDHRMAECAVVIEVLERNLAAELGARVYEHLFRKNGKVRSEIETINIDPDVPQQRVDIHLAVDSKARSVVLLNVDVLGITAKRETDSEKTAEWFKLTIKLRFSLAEKVHREFLARKFGTLLCWTFHPEQHPLDLEGE